MKIETEGQQQDGEKVEMLRAQLCKSEMSLMEQKRQNALLGGELSFLQQELERERYVSLNAPPFISLCH